MPARTMLLAVALLAACPVAAVARDLTVVTRGDTSADAVHRVLAGPFSAATGIPVQVGHWAGGIDALRTQLKNPTNTWDVVELGPDELATACSENLVEKLDWSAIGGKSHYLPPAVSDCGVGAVLTTLVLAWDRGKSATPPNWADFWDVAKYPGKRGLYKGVRGNLELALMADGVAPADVYKVLATSEGVDRAFRKLDQLRPYIVWWDNGAQAAHILRSGDVLMTTAPAADIIALDRQAHADFGIQWNAGLSQVQSWAIAKGSPDLHQAEQFLYFAGMPAMESRLFDATGLSGMAQGANELLAPGEQALAATTPANMNAALRMDSGFWHDNLARLRQRFDAWLQAQAAH